ncbi:MAG: protein kinase domain-containing protein, partial [Nannocystaceae bacterium]
MSESDPTIRESRLGRGLAGVAQIDSQQLDDAMARVEQLLLGGSNDDNDGSAVPSSRFVILRELGAGGCGRVYLAYDTELDRRVALKQLLRRSQADEALLIREAQLLAQLRHPNIVNVHDMTEVTASGGRPRLCIIMEYVEGVTLRTWLAEEKPTNAEILRVLCAAGRGLAAAHAAGIIHRDFKPENVILDADGQARVLDFGLSQGPGKEPDLAASGEHTSTESDIEELAVGISGTPSYMAPERFVEPGGDVRSDIFSFAVTVWEALAGCRPFAGRTIYVLRRRMLKGEFAQVAPKRKLPGRIERVLRQALAVDPQARFDSLDVLLGELERDPWLRFRRVAQVLGAFLVVAASVVLIVLATRPARIVVEVVGPHGPLPPSGVWVDEQPLDLVANGANGESPPGVHRLRVEAPGMQPGEEIVTLERGDLHRHAIVVQPQQGTLEVEATPVGAS